MLMDVIGIVLLALFVFSIAITLLMATYLMFEETGLGQDILEWIREKRDE